MSVTKLTAASGKYLHIVGKWLQEKMIFRRKLLQEECSSMLGNGFKRREVSLENCSKRNVRYLYIGKNTYSFKRKGCHWKTAARGKCLYVGKWFQEERGFIGKLLQEESTYSWEMASKGEDIIGKLLEEEGMSSGNMFVKMAPRWVQEERLSSPTFFTKQALWLGKTRQKKRNYVDK